MPANRKYRSRARQTGNRATPALIGTLAQPGNLETTASLACRLGNPPFDRLTEAEAICELHRLWPIHREAATEYCIRRFGPEARPELWWHHDSPEPRPYVRPRDWCLDGDRERYEKERAAADLQYLRKHNYLTKEEVAALEENTAIRRATQRAHL